MTAASDGQFTTCGLRSTSYLDLLPFTNTSAVSDDRPVHFAVGVCDVSKPSTLQCAPAVIQKARCYCQMECQAAPQSNTLANPPYAIHNFAWKEGLSNNDNDRVKLRDGILTGHLDAKGISVTASECTARYKTA